MLERRVVTIEEFVEALAPEGDALAGLGRCQVVHGVSG